MLKTSRRFVGQFAGVLTIIALASFAASQAKAQSANASAFRDNPAWTAENGVLTTLQASGEETGLRTGIAYQDSVASFDFKAPPGAKADIYALGRYGVTLEGNGEWQTFSWRFRAPRFDEGYNKKENALLLEAHVGPKVLRNVIYPGASPGAHWGNEDFRGPTFIQVRQGPFSVRNLRNDSADFSQVNLPPASGGHTNEKDLVDTVAVGKSLFTSVGCEACHQVEPDSAAVSAGPNLFGLLRPEPRQREVAEGAE